MRSLLARGVDHRENRREIEFLSGHPVFDTAAACVIAIFRAPVFVQRFGDLLRRRVGRMVSARFRLRRFAPSMSAIGERRVVHKPCVIMVA